MVIGPMAYDMARYPSSMSERTQVRDAQLEFVQQYLEPELASKWRYATDGEWAKHCDDLLYENKAPYVFTFVLQRVQGACGGY